MKERNNNRALTFAALATFSATVAIAQAPALPEVPVSTQTSNAWQLAESASASERKLLVVTVDQPDRRQTCHVHSFTADKLVCSRAIGASRTYLRPQIIALLFPGDGNLKLEHCSYSTAR